MGLECDMESSQEELLETSVAVGQVATRRRTFTLVAGLITMCAAISMWHNPSIIAKVKGGFFLGLDEEVEVDANCEGLPFVHLDKVISSNLGKQGPDTNATEGIIYAVTATNTGVEAKNLQIHVHSLASFDVKVENETSHDHDYRPAFTTGQYVNGIYGKFACVNVKQNTSLKLRAHAYDADKKEDIALPHGAISFFDLDTGKDNILSVEHVTIKGHTGYYLSNETEINVSHVDGYTVFTATKEGTGDDNPSDPVSLSPLQKDRAISIEFEDKSKIDWEVGVSAGHTARVFSFVFRPSLLCAKTKIGSDYFPATGSKAPIIAVHGGAFQGLPSVLLMFGLTSVLVQSFM